VTTVTVQFRDMWRRTVERFPARAAIEVATTGAQTSYAELHREAQSLARRLGDAGTTAGQLVGLRTADRRRFCVGLLGVWLADAVPIPLSATAPDTYVQRLIRRLGTAAVLIEDDSLPSGIGPSLQPREPVPAIDVSSTTGLAYVMHTSGSTGQPKPVGLSHQALAAYCTAFTAATGLADDDRFLQLAPVTFDVVFEELLPIWSVGGTAVLAPGAPDDPGRLLADIEARRVTVAELTTVYWGLLVRYLRAFPRTVPTCLRLLLVGGERASIDLIEESLGLGLPLAHVYGVTEAGITSTIQFFEPGRPITAVSVGVPLSNSTVHVVDDAGSPVPTGASGEVWIGGDSLAEGYLGNPQETARRFVEVSGNAPSPGRYYRTGDAGRITLDGELEILGRLDAQVKVNGVRVDPTEVEAALGSSTLVVEAAVITVRGPDGAGRLHGFVVPAHGTDPLTVEQTLRRSLRALLPHHLVPERVIALDALPVTEHGKVDRRALARGHHHDIEPAEGRAWTPSQRLVATAWTTVLGLPPTGLDQNFGDAGGDSLALLTLVVNLGETGVTVTSADCLARPTVRMLAAFLDRAATDNPASAAPNSASPLEEQQRHEERRRHLQRRRATRRGAP
jgi:amino acid adenylation domain-containing protein